MTKTTKKNSSVKVNRKHFCQKQWKSISQCFVIKTRKYACSGTMGVQRVAPSVIWKSFTCAIWNNSEESGTQFYESVIRENRPFGIRNPGLSWISLHGMKRESNAWKYCIGVLSCDRLQWGELLVYCPFGQ